MSKAIYMPKGKAGEYAKYACNFYVGCSNDCEYCYCKRGILGHAMGAPKATLKKCFKDEIDAILTFEKELMKNLEEIRKHGLFFTFTSDPMLDNTRKLTIQAVDFAIRNDINCKILTKRADFIDSLPQWWFYKEYRGNIAFGFTLTGHDEMEPGASTNAERIEAMRELHKMGFKTFASIEPIFTLIARMDKSPAYLATAEKGTPPGIQSEDSEYTRLIKEFMVEHHIINIYMRMLSVTELKQAQGFPIDYTLIGTQTEQKKFIGNAVEVHMSTALCEALAARLNE